MAKVLVSPSGAEIQPFSELLHRGANALKKILYKMCVPFIFHLAYSDVTFSFNDFSVVFFSMHFAQSHLLCTVGERFENSFKINTIFLHLFLLFWHGLICDKGLQIHSVL